MKINISTQKEAEISDALIEKIKEKLCKMDPPQVYWDYRDQLSEEQAAKILSSPDGLNDVENEIWERNFDYSYDMEIEHLVDALGWFKAELEEELGEEDIDLKELAKELRDEFLDYLSVDINIKGLLSNTPSVNCRVELYSNYDCINSNWFEQSAGGYTYEDSYFGAIVDALNLNPIKVKEIFEERGMKMPGEYPDKPERNGQEYVDYKAFAIEMENDSCGAGLLCIVCKVDLSDVIEHGGMPTKFIIPKGNNVGIYSSMQGGGSMIECPLIRDMVVDTKARGETEYDHLSLIPDTKEHGYTIDDAYGVHSDFFGDEIKFIKE